MKIDIEALKKFLRDAKNGYIKDVDSIELDEDGWVITDNGYYYLLDEDEIEE